MGEPGWRSKYPHKLALYAAHYRLVEVNSTFYKLPKPTTAEKWRELADSVDPEFEFTVKAYQGLTHEARFRGEAARESFKGTLEIARALRARIVLIQTPASFRPTADNVAALEEFFGGLGEHGFTLVWEPRGKWEREEAQVERICRLYGLIHCTDPFRSLPVLTGPLTYLRLHGSPPGQRMYRYTYTDSDLRWLAGELQKLNVEEVYLLFNNDTMYGDALRFLRIWEGG